MDLATFKAANERRDAATLAMFTEVLDRMLEAEQEFIRYGRPGGEYNGPKCDAAKERRNRHRGVLLDAYEHALADNSNLTLKILELDALKPRAPVIITRDEFRTN